MAKTPEIAAGALVYETFVRDVRGGWQTAGADDLLKAALIRARRHVRASRVVHVYRHHAMSPRRPEDLVMSWFASHIVEAKGPAYPSRRQQREA